ncbi:MAG: hypothetical protein N2441_10620 [Rhodocyclaceae bacterium]|nr:hypothetical protein [Rhodocyclaceae bacterium]
MRSRAALGVAFGLCLWAQKAVAGEIIFVDPAREKAQALPKAKEGPSRVEKLLEHTLEEARMRSGREPVAPPGMSEETNSASELANEARAQRDGQALPTAPLILRSGPAPSEATKARQSARGWVAAPPSADSRCQSGNVVGSIEGQTQGHTVIQGQASGVKAICK